MTLEESIEVEIKETEQKISLEQSYLGKLRKMLARAMAEKAAVKVEVAPAPKAPLNKRGRPRKRRPKGYLAKRAAEVLKGGPMPMKEIKATLEKQGEKLRANEVHEAIVGSAMFKRHGYGVYGLANGKSSKA